MLSEIFSILTNNRSTHVALHTQADVFSRGYAIAFYYSRTHIFHSTGTTRSAYLLCRQQNRPHEIYSVAPDNAEKFEGRYIRYYPNGNPALEGFFVNGKKSGVFTEYHENGIPSRKITYVNGMRHGPVEIYDENGKKIQKAFYQNDLLVDSAHTFYDDGTLWREAVFKKVSPME